MVIDGIMFNSSLEDILQELDQQIKIKHIPLFQKGFRDNGQYIMCQCPYHKEGQERKLSAGLRKDNGLFHCFACGQVHSLPEFISFSFYHSNDILGKYGWKWLIKNFATTQVEGRKDVDLDFARDGLYSDCSKHDRSDSSGDSFVSEVELDSYRYSHPYLYARGMTDEIIEMFDLGYDRASKTITFPVKDSKGHCLFIARRAIDVKWYNYPKGVEKPLYGLYELQTKPGYLAAGEVIICEGIFDALTCWVNRKPAVALMGLGNELQFKQLRQLSCRKLILALDNDSAGQLGRQRLRDRLQNTHIITELVLPFGKKDLNELTETEFCNMQEIF